MTLTVTAGASDPTITRQPTDQTVVAGRSTTLSVEATGAAPLRYQWLKNGVNIPGETSPVLSLPSAIGTDNGATFRAVVSNAAGSVTSIAATLTVASGPAAPIIVTYPERSRVLTNQTGFFSVAAWSPAPIGYQWQKGTFASADNFVNIAGANGPTYSTPMTALTDHLALFRCVVTNVSGSTTSASEMLFVTTSTVTPKEFTSDIRAAAQAGVPFSHTIRSSGGTAPVRYTAQPLPEGLSLDPGTGVISGTPAATGVTAILITATNSAGGISDTLILAVTSAPPVVPFSQWLRNHFGASANNQSVASERANPDGDGMPNLIEYAFARDPLAADRPDFLSSGIQADPANRLDFLTVSAAKNPAATNVAYSAQVCADLAAPQWTNDVTVLQDSQSAFQVRDNTRASSAVRRFMRLTVRRAL